MEYVRSLVPTMIELFGTAETHSLLGRTARLIGMQFYDDIAGALAIEPGGAANFALYLGALAAAQGEVVDVDGAVVRQRGWRLMEGIDVHNSVFDAWNALWCGALSVHDRRLSLTSERNHGEIVWRIAG